MAKDVQECQRRYSYLQAIFVFQAALCMLLCSIPLISTTPLAPDTGPAAALSPFLLTAACSSTPQSSVRAPPCIRTRLGREGM